MLVLDILVGVLILGLFYFMLPKFAQIGSAVEKKIEAIKEQSTEVIPDGSDDTKVSVDENLESHEEEK